MAHNIPDLWSIFTSEEHVWPFTLHIQALSACAKSPRYRICQCSGRKKSIVRRIHVSMAHIQLFVQAE
jgi:hypothetical protein